MQDIDQRDRELLNALQGDVPLASTPFAIIGQMIDMSEKEVIKRIERLKREGVIKQVSAQFDMRALGYRSCLVAASVSDEKVEQAANAINAHPGVTQNYRRNHTLNLWFTIAVGGSSKLGLDRTIEILGEQAECDAIRPLPTLKLYKTSNADGAETHAENEAETTASLSSQEIECIRLLQRDLPLHPRPFETLARNAALGADEILNAAKALLTRGQMRRFGAFVQPRKSGFVATAMGIWVVPTDRADELGRKMAENRAVSHCYLRPTYDDWPYNLYTTVHGRSVDECESIINDLAIDSGLEDKRALYPTREFKKARLQFFSPEAEEWESAHVGAREAAAS
ncbi:MAG TPA: AsnC family transcriptional regulator [Thermoanaerobaculia bacterium]|jgi:DNA-binding Lrp family transcriptional regulator